MNRTKFLAIILFVLLVMPIRAQEIDWCIVLGLSGRSEVLQIVTDNDDNVYVHGIMSNSGSVDLDPGPVPHLLSWNFGGLPGSGRFIAKYDSSGSFLWGSRFDALRHLSVTPQGALSMLLYLDGSVDVDPGPGTVTLNSSEGTAVVRWSTDGDLVSAFALNGVHASHAKPTANGDLYVFGNFIDSVDIDPGPGITTLFANAYYDTWLAKYNVQGQLLWGHAIGGAGSDYAAHIATRGQNLLVSLRTIGSVLIDQIDADPGPDTAMTAFSQNQGALLIQFTANGDYVGHTGFDWPADWWSPLIGAIPDGSTVLGGSFGGTARFPTPDSTLVIQSTGTDSFIHKMNANGSPAWTDLFSAYGNLTIFALYPAKDGAILVSGFFTHYLDVDPSNQVIGHSTVPPGNAWIGAYCGTDGSHIWSAIVDGADRNSLRTLEWSRADAMLLGGGCSNNADLGLGGTPYIINTSATGAAFVARYRQVATDCEVDVGIDAESTTPSILSLRLLDNTLWVLPGGTASEMVIYDPCGRVVYRSRVTGPTAQVDIGTWSTGIYIVQVVQDDKRMLAKFVRF